MVPTGPAPMPLIMLQSSQILIVHYFLFFFLLQVCQYGANENGSPHPYSCGISKNAVLVMSSFSPLKFTITYTGGEGDR